MPLTLLNYVGPSRHDLPLEVGWHSVVVWDAWSLQCLCSETWSNSGQEGEELKRVSYSRRTQQLHQCCLSHTPVSG